jgi:hypothetical protein
MELKRCREEGLEFDPTRVINRVFFLDGPEHDDEDDEEEPDLRGWETAWIEGSGDDIPEEFKTALFESYHGLQAIVGEESDEKAMFEGLASQYSWAGFMVTLILWARARNEEINGAVEELGGIQLLAETLQMSYKSFLTGVKSDVRAVEQQPRRQSKGQRKSHARKSYVECYGLLFAA